MQGEAYATGRLFSESGGVGSNVLDEQPGAGLTAASDCEVAVGELCLALTEAGAETRLCPQ